MSIPSPPFWFYIRVRDKGQNVIGLWLPLLLIWLLLLPFVLLAFILIFISDLLTAFRFRLTRLLAGIFTLSVWIKGTTIRVDNVSEDSSVLVTIL
jgi:hypothetical protein